MDPDPVCPERLDTDPDPVNIRPDPKPWPWLLLMFLLLIMISLFLLLFAVSVCNVPVLVDAFLNPCCCCYGACFCVNILIWFQYFSFVAFGRSFYWFSQSLLVVNEVFYWIMRLIERYSIYFIEFCKRVANSLFVWFLFDIIWREFIA